MRTDEGQKSKNYADVIIGMALLKWGGHRVAVKRKRDSVLRCLCIGDGIGFGRGKTGIFFGFVTMDCDIARSISVVPEMPGSKYQNNK